MFQNDVFGGAIAGAKANAVASHFYGIHHFETKHCPRNLPKYRYDEGDRFWQYR